MQGVEFFNGGNDSLLHIMDGRREAKRYYAQYTCLSNRTIHIEVVHSLSTDSFIMSLGRHVGCRDKVKITRFDNGLNFVSATAELICAFQQMDHIEISNIL